VKNNKKRKVAILLVMIILSLTSLYFLGEDERKVEIVVNVDPISYSPDTSNCDVANNIYCVSPSGAGTRNGSSGNEMTFSESLNYAYNQSSTIINNTITFLLAGGEYGRVEVRSRNRGEGAWITYKSMSKTNKAIFRGEGVYPGIYIQRNNKAFIIFDSVESYANSTQAYGIEIDSTNYTTVESSYIQGPYSNGTNGYAISAAISENITINNNEIVYGNNGINARDIKDLQVIGNTVREQIADGIHQGGYLHNFIIENNTINNISEAGYCSTCHNDGLQIDASSTGVHNGTIRGNKISNIEGQGLFIGTSGHGNYAIQNITIEKNIIHGNFGAPPMQIIDKASNITIRKNTIIPNSTYTSVIDYNTSGILEENIILTAITIDSRSWMRSNYNIIKTYLNSSGGITLGTNDVVGINITLDSKFAPTTQNITNQLGQTVNPCTMSSTSSHIGAVECATITSSNSVTQSNTENNASTGNNSASNETQGSENINQQSSNGGGSGGSSGSSGGSSGGGGGAGSSSGTSITTTNVTEETAENDTQERESVMITSKSEPATNEKPQKSMTKRVLSIGLIILTIVLVVITVLTMRKKE
jgi:hypothetical protein